MNWYCLQLLRNPIVTLAIKKLDIKVTTLHKTICDLPKCMLNVVTQLPHDMFGMGVFSLKNTYIKCIGKQLINVLKDKDKLERIHKGLIRYILARYIGAQNLTRRAHDDCTRSPITITLFLLKQPMGPI